MNDHSPTPAKAGHVLITGAAHRIGRCIALDLAAHGWDVALHYHQSTEKAEETADEISRLGRRALLIQGDLSDTEAVNRMTPQVLEKFGSLECLINNASLFEDDNIDSVTAQSWHAHIDTNLLAPLLLSQAFAAQAGEGSNIINLLDQRVWKLTPHFLSYTVSKTGLWTLTQTLAMALAERRIRVNAIGPGPTLPNTRQSDQHFRDQSAAVPLGRGPTTGEICDAVRYVLGAPSLTGQMIALDGGQHLAWQTPDILGIPE